MNDESASATDTALDLEQQLRSAVKLATDYKQENATLKRELDDARAISLKNQQRNAEWRESWKKELHVVEMREKELEREELKRKQRMEEHKLELETMERKFASLSDKDAMGLLTADLFKQLENEHSSKMNRLIEEAAKWRESYYQARQSSEQFQAKYDECKAQVQREQETSDALQKTIVSLQESFARHFESSEKANSNHAEDMVRDLKRQLDDRDLLLSSLHEERRVVEKERDEAVTAKDVLVVSHQSEIHALKQECAKIESRNQILERRLATKEKLINDASKNKTELEEKSDWSTKEINRLQSCLELEKAANEAEVNRLRNEMIQSKAELAKQLLSVKTLLVDEQEKSKRLEHRCVETHEHAMKHISELAKGLEKRDDCAEKLIIAKDEIIKLENAVAALHDDKLQANRVHDAECHRLQHAIETCHQELSLAMMEKSEFMKSCDAEKARTDQLQKDLVACEALLKRCEQKCQLLEEEKSKLSALVEDHLCQKETLQHDLRVLSSRTQEMKESVFKARVEADEWKDQLSKEKRRSEAYKCKAMEAHRRSVKAKEVLDSLCHKDGNALP